MWVGIRIGIRIMKNKELGMERSVHVAQCRVESGSLAEESAGVCVSCSGSTHPASFTCQCLG